MQVSTQMGPFSIVPEWVLDRGLSSTALKLYIVLARFADWETGIAFPSRDTLADRIGSTPKTIDRLVKELVDAECIEKQSRGRYASAKYRVFQVDPRGTKMSEVETEMSGEGTKMSSRLDKNVHLTITNEQEPLKQEPLNVERPKKEHRIPDDWKPSNDLLALFATKWPDLDPEVDVETFTLYWQSRTERRADWDKTFVVWMNKEQRQRSKYSRKTFQEQAWDKTLKAAEAFLADEDEATEETNPNGDNRLWINFKNGDE
jgi:DNA-binding transcriptional regulator YhcF (GntR family)